MQEDHTLAILYDLALTISGETRVAPLLSKITQRLLYHTTFPCGYFLTQISTDDSNPASDLLTAEVEVALCSRQLSVHEGEILHLPRALIEGPAATIDDMELIQQAFPHNNKYEIALRLPVDKQNVFLLLSSKRENQRLPIAQIFEPVLRNFSTTLTMCRDNEKYTRELQKEIEDRIRYEQQLSDFKTTLDLTFDSVFIFEPDTLRFTYCNQGAVNHVGYNRDELLKMTPMDLKPEFNKTSMKTLLEPLLKQQQSLLHFETIHQHKNGTLIPVDILVQYITPKNRAPRFVAIVRNITEQKIHQNALQYAKEEAESANRAKSEFLSRMSHELRTPMNAILGFSQLLLMDDDNPLNEDQKQSAKEILKAGDHLLELINDVLDLSKIESGKFHMSFESLSLANIVIECISLTRPLANNNQISIHNNIGPEKAFYVWADYTRLKQVLLNLISNAIKYNRANGSIIINAYKTQNNTIRLGIEDTGIGIDPSKLQQVFVPFERLDAEKGPTEGTGIGLTITKRLIELMGGTVNVESKPNIGSTFWIELKTAEPKSQGHKTTDKEPIQGTPDNENTTTILYIEDNPANLRLVEKIAKKNQNINFISAHNANLGIELAKGHRPDLILMDINLPGMDGYQALDILRSFPETQNTPVIAISANAMSRDVKKGKKAGFFDYIIKPINIEQLKQAINLAIE